mgnify:CR=1 FL=1
MQVECWRDSGAGKFVTEDGNLTQAKLSMQGDIAIVTLDNAPQNRLSPEMLDDLAAILNRVKANDPRAVVITAEGPDFSFGGDIVPWVDMTTSELRSLFERYMRIFNEFEQLRMPTVAVAQGKCFGGGFELALRADVIFAGETAIFGHPEQSLAIVTVLGGIYRVAERAGRAKAIEWAFTSQPVPAAEMAAHGVVNQVIADDKLLETAMAFAEGLAKGPTRAHMAHKAILRIFAAGGSALADDAIFDIAMPLFETEDVKTALPASATAFLEKKPRPAVPFTVK